MKRNRKAKIVTTLGPASSSPEIIEKLFIEGTDVFRLNFSHGSIEEHRKNSGIIRNLEKKYEYSSCILADLQGPKLRIGKFENKSTKLKLGQKFKFDLSNKPGDTKRVNFPHPDIYEILTPNSIILIDDGKIIVTNLHVVQNATKVTVEFPDGRTFRSKGYLAVNPDKDLITIRLPKKISKVESMGAVRKSVRQ